MTEEDFRAWLKEARPGAIYTYAEATCLAHAKPESQRVATLALSAFYAGTVDLVQRRMSKTNGKSDCGTFAYLCIKRRHIETRTMPYWLKPAWKPKQRVFHNVEDLVT